MFKFVNRRGLTLEYERIGEGTPLLFLHGMGGSVEQIKSSCDPIEGVQLIILNQQGHGNSEVDWDHLDFTAMGEDAIALLDHLGIQKAYFAGISMGAAVSLNVAARHPNRVKALLLIRNAWTDQPMSPDVQRAYYDLGSCLHEGGLDAFYQTKGWRIAENTSNYTKNAFLIPFHEESNLRNWKKFLILPSKTPVEDIGELRGIKIPTAILANKNDLCHPFSYGVHLQGMIPGATFTEIPAKDADSALHRKMLNEAVRKMIAQEGAQ